MSKDLNLVTLIGRLVRDPEIKYTAGGTPVTKFSIANNETYLQNNERKDYVNYFDINVWGNQAINCEKYLKKGSQVAITGSLRQSRWTDNASGQVKSKIEITANTVQFLSFNQGNGAPNTSSPPPTTKQQNNSGQNQNYGMIEDPWGDNNSMGHDDNQYVEQINTDDDIPF